MYYLLYDWPRLVCLLFKFVGLKSPLAGIFFAASQSFDMFSLCAPAIALYSIARFSLLTRLGRSNRFFEECQCEHKQPWPKYYIGVRGHWLVPCARSLRGQAQTWRWGNAEHWLYTGYYRRLKPESIWVKALERKREKCLDCEVSGHILSIFLAMQRVGWDYAINMIIMMAASCYCRHFSMPIAKRHPGRCEGCRKHFSFLVFISLLLCSLLC